MRYLAELADDNGDATSITYGDTPLQMATWDAAKIHGCKCDAGYHIYAGTNAGDVPDYTGYDCSLRTCPTGDDPSSAGGVVETQSFTCTGSAGSFTLTFRQHTSASIAHGADVNAVTAAIEGMKSVGDVTVTMSQSTACTGGGTAITVVFNEELGDLPLLSGTATGGPALSAFAEDIKGTKENVECSNKGTCDRTTGRCRCFPGYASSDGAGGLGRRGDCGHVTELSV